MSGRDPIMYGLAAFGTAPRVTTPGLRAIGIARPTRMLSGLQRIGIGTGTAIGARPGVNGADGVVPAGASSFEVVRVRTGPTRIPPKRRAWPLLLPYTQGICCG